MTKLALIALGVAAAAAAACGSPQMGGTTPSRGRNSSVITAEELNQSNATNLYEAVDRLRPRWLRTSRSPMLPGTGGEVVVYLERSRMGGPDVLKQLQLTSVRSIRYFSPSEAEAEFGLGHLNGVIQVSMATGTP